MLPSMDRIVATCIFFTLSACGGGSTDSSDLALAPPQASAPVTEGNNSGEDSPSPSPPSEEPTPPPVPEEPSSDGEGETVAIDLLNARWMVTDLTALLPERGSPVDLNDAGDIIGIESITEEGPPGTLGRLIGRRAFIISNNTYIPIKGAYNSPKINNFGQISVNLWDDRYLNRWAPYEELVFSDGAVQTNPIQLDLPSGLLRAVDLNNEGHILGTHQNDTFDVQRPFIYYRGQITTFEPISPWTNTDARAINDHGDFVGCAYVTHPSHCEVGYVYRDGRYYYLGQLPGKSYANPIDINNSGQIIGYANNAEDNSAGLRKSFIYENGTIRELELPGYGVSLRQINDFGQIVGYGYRSATNLTQFAYVVHQGQVIELSDVPDIKAAGYRIFAVSAINNRGQILAYGSPIAGGMSRRLLLTPEPLSTSETTGQ